MKTLTEVINKLECYPISPSTLPISVSIVTVEDLHEALFYLKEYRDRQENLDQFETYQFTQNLPLTWDELKQMKGKAIWAEYEEYKAWHIIESFNYNPYYGGDRILFTDNAMFLKKDMGEKWKAYRKERE